MPDKWDIAPWFPPPRTPINLRTGVNQPLSAEQLELYEQQRKEYIRQYLRQKVEQVKDKMKFLRRYRQQLADEEFHRYVKGCVYLMWCPTLVVHKIGYTNDLQRRIDEHRRNLDPQIECLNRYQTLIELDWLEKVVHNHFRDFHITSDKSEELFKLPQKEVDGFEATLVVIERHLLAMEFLRLKTLLSKFKAECLETE